ncbi:MAG: peptidylprolyl isomerase [Vicinamibacterales bacterium]
MSTLRTSSLVALALTASLARLGAEEPAVVVRAALGGRTVSVTVDELKLEVAMMRRNNSGAPLVFADAAALEPVARTVLRRKLLAVEAARRHLDSETTVVNLVTRSTDAVLAEVISSREAEAVDSGDAAARAFYDAHADLFRSAPRRKVRHIVVPTEADARAARAAIAAGATFEAVARSRNTDRTSAVGGDLGWIARGSMVRPFDEAVFALERGKVGGPVQTSMGWHLVLVEDVDPGNLPPLALVRDRVIETMRQQAIDGLALRLMATAKPVIDRAALEELVK